MKKYILFLFVFGISLISKSQAVDYNTALNIAKNTISERISHIDADINYKPTSHTTESINENTVFYVFNLDPQGFIIISGDKSATPLLAFSTESNYEINDKNPAAEFWINTYKQQINYNIQNNITPKSKTQNEWIRLSKDPADFSAKNNIKTVTKLLHTTWDQGRYYNAHCPEDPAGTDGRVVVGCVATALGQVINYFRYPEQGTGSYGYEHPDYGWIEVDFSQQNYNYDQMPIKPTDYNDDIARLLYNIGVSVDMDYGSNSSGMWNHKGAYTLRTYFGYDDSCTYLFKDSLPEDFDWNGTLVEHLNQNIPLYYAGWGDYDYISGHAFVLDGYSDSTHYHINWGWGGSSDGYFVIDNLTPGGSNFKLAHEVIINATPLNPTINCADLKELNTIEGIIDDGSGPINHYLNNTECMWLINPQDSVSGIAFEVLNLKMDENDYIVFFNGENDTDPVITTIYGNSTIQDFESTSDKVLIKFVTDADSVNNGWLIAYKGVQPRYCQLTQTLTEPTGVITDGSNSYLYQNNTFCNWKIQPEGANNIRITFTEFDIEPTKDYLRITNSTGQSVAKLSGNTIPEPIIIMGEKITITFRTESTPRHQGFSLYYEINKDGIDDDFAKKINIYPNPAIDKLNINIENNINPTDITIYNTNGKLIKSIAKSEISEHINIDLSDMAQGLYYVNIVTDKTIFKHKFVKL
ncbi:MAG: C10 family peptidase [Bacteroidales bacterium]|nr:C10 family peptidase [Bacteroidales bacterium]MDY0141613.1 C10 family peptidase [Bacteroidales bacterium]